MQICQKFNLKKQQPFIFAFLNCPFPVYLDIGAESDDDATLTFAFDGTDTTAVRRWDIKVTQIECDNPNR